MEFYPNDQDCINVTCFRNHTFKMSLIHPLKKTFNFILENKYLLNNLLFICAYFNTCFFLFEIFLHFDFVKKKI